MHGAISGRCYGLHVKILVIGATGTIGSAVVESLTRRNHDVVRASRNGEIVVDITDTASIVGAYRAAQPLDAVVVTAGSARMSGLDKLTHDDFSFSLASKLMGQVDVVRLGLERLKEGGSFTLTSGILAHQPVPGSAAISMVNAGLEAFASAAALEMPRGMRINVVSPPWVAETLEKMGRDPSGGLPAAQVARAYIEAVEGKRNGEVLDPAKFG